MNQTTVCIPEPLILRAKVFQINVSAVCREALADVVEQFEKETQVEGTTPHRLGSDQPHKMPHEVAH